MSQESNMAGVDLVIALMEQHGITLDSIRQRLHEKSGYFKLVLINYPTHSKVQVVRIVREMTGLGLVDAKWLVDSLPRTIQSRYFDSLEQEKYRKMFLELGAEISFESN